MEIIRKSVPLDPWKVWVLVVVLLWLGMLGDARGMVQGLGSSKSTGNESRTWVEDKLSRLSIRQKIGQLFMVTVFAQADTRDGQILL
ncbi:MAG: hypothetical protein ACKOFE_06270, partial [Bacteroidota bacterium]